MSGCREEEDDAAAQGDDDYDGHDDDEDEDELCVTFPAHFLAAAHAFLLLTLVKCFACINCSLAMFFLFFSLSANFRHFRLAVELLTQYFNGASESTCDEMKYNVHSTLASLFDLSVASASEQLRHQQFSCTFALSRKYK